MPKKKEKSFGHGRNEITYAGNPLDLYMNDIIYCSDYSLGKISQSHVEL